MSHRLSRCAKTRALLPRTPRILLDDNVWLGTAMLALAEVDGLVSGAVHSTASTIRPALQIIKTRPGAKVVSSIFFMCLPDQVLVYADCAVNPDPDAETLADIAIQRTCEKITKCRVAAGFLAWPRREGGGNTRSGVADALHRPAGCLRQAVSLRSAVPPEQRRPSQKDTQPCGREQERPSGRVARSVTARCGDAPSRAPCHTAFLALARRFLIFSQVLKAPIPRGGSAFRRESP